VVSVQRTFTVNKPLDTVVDYLKDFSRAQEWDPGTELCIRQDPGPVREGSTWLNVSVFLGRRTELTYRLQRLERDRLTFVGHNATAVSTDDLTFSAGDGVTSITYRAQIRLSGPARLASPLLRLALERLANKVTAQMSAVIDAL
jgi:carbon monoxide dehydrogenase subunit G